MRLVQDPISSFPPDVVYQTNLQIGTGYDPQSIMQYNETDKNAFQDGERSPCFRATPVSHLSARDRLAASIAYDGTGRSLAAVPGQIPIIDPVTMHPISGAPIVLNQRARQAVLEALALR
jgi:hypothetical protein